MSTFDSGRERQRASFAFKLTRWRNEEGQKLPQDESGIAQHQEAVRFYEDMYGPISEGGHRQYENLYAGIRAGMQAAKENRQSTAKLMADAERDKAEAAQAAARRLDLLRAQRSIREASGAIDQAEERLALLEKKIIPSTKGKIALLETDLDRLRVVLSRYEEGGRRYQQIEEMCDHNEDMLEGLCQDMETQQDEITTQFSILAGEQARMARMQSIIDGDDIIPSAPETPFAEPDPWWPKSQGWHDLTRAALKMFVSRLGGIDVRQVSVRAQPGKQVIVTFVGNGLAQWEDPLRSMAGMEVNLLPNPSRAPGKYGSGVHALEATITAEQAAAILAGEI